MSIRMGLFIAICGLSFPLLISWGGAHPSSGFASPAVPVSIAQVRGPSAADWMGRHVTVEGFYYGETIAMIVDDIKRVYVNTPIPQDAYLPIVGPIPPGLKTGDRVAATGIVSRPGPGDPPEVAKEKTILRVHEAGQIRVLERKKSG